MVRVRGALTALLPLVAVFLQEAVLRKAAAQVPSDPIAEIEERRSEERDMLARARAEQSGRAAPAQPPGPDAGMSTDPADVVRSQAIEAEVARRVRQAEHEAGLEPTALTAPRPALPPTAAAPQPSGPARATVLLTITPGSKGIRRLKSSADPILCMGAVCWISRGAEQDARMLPRRVALGTLRTLGERAGACNDSTTCVFRNVELTTGATLIEPVDLRLLRHDRRTAREVIIDRSCRAERGAVRCEAAQVGPDYELLVVPEAVAQSAGPSALRSTVGADRRRWDEQMR